MLQVPAPTIDERRDERVVPTLWPEDGKRPQHPTYEQERLYRKQRLAAGCRIFARFGFDNGGAGHITVRDPEYPEHFWVNPAATAFNQVRVSDLLLLDEAGDKLEGEGVVNHAAFSIHSRLHAARPDVVAAAHSHSLYGKIWSTLGRLLDPLTQDACAFYECHGIHREFSGIVWDLEEGDRIAEAAGNGKALILQNHGILTVGGSIESAVWWYLSFEDACRVQLAAEAAGKPRLIQHEVAVHTREQACQDVNGVYGFKPYWDIVLREEPDFLD